MLWQLIKIAILIFVLQFNTNVKTVFVIRQVFIEGRFLIGSLSVVIFFEHKVSVLTNGSFAFPGC